MRQSGEMIEIMTKLERWIEYNIDKLWEMKQKNGRTNK